MRFYQAKPGCDWSKRFYRYANRLAHLYFLRVLNKKPAYLVFVYFVNDTQMKGPESREEWEGAIKLLNTFLDLKRHKLSPFVVDVFIDVNKLR